MKTLDQYNQETLLKAISKGYEIRYVEHKTKNRPNWYSIEILENDRLISGYGSAEFTEAIKLAKEFINKE